MLIIFVCIDFNDKVDMWLMSLQIQNYVVFFLHFDSVDWRNSRKFELRNKFWIHSGFKIWLLDLKDVHSIILSQVFFSISRSRVGKQTFLNSGPYVINAKWLILYQTNIKTRIKWHFLQMCNLVFNLINCTELSIKIWQKLYIFNNAQ